MIRKHQQLPAVLSALLDGLLLVGAYMLSAWLWLTVHKQDSVNMAVQPDTLPMACVYALLVVLIQAVLGCYDFSRTRSLRSVIPACWLANLAGILCGMSVMYLLRLSDFSRGVLGLFFATGCLLMAARQMMTRRLLHALRRMGYNRCRVLLIGTGSNALRYADAIAHHPGLGFEPVGCLGEENTGLPAPRLGSLEDLAAVLESLNPDEAVIALDDELSARTSEVIAACERAGVRCSVVPSYAALIPHGVTMESIGETRLLSLRSNPLDNVGNAFLKRSFDVVVSALLLVLLAPLLCVSALGVRLSGRPVIYRQQRVGLNKRPFTMLKLRSMRACGEENDGWTTGDDPRRTRVGAFLRKFSIDELPQLVNVLRGDMSLVGPRPERPHYVEKYAAEVPRYMVKHQVRPGITGWAQVNGWRGDTSIRERIAHDVWYIEHWSPVLDLRILLRTALGGFINNEMLLRRKR